MKNKKLIVLLLALVAVMAISFAGCAPTTYDVSYVGGTGATGTAPTAEKYEEGKELTLPANTFVKEGYTFAGWSDGAKVYEAGSKYTVGKVAVVFTATWTKIEDVVGVAYGLVHGQGYVGQATVSVNHKGVVTDATLDEACFPSQVVLSAEEQAKLDKNDYTTFAGKHGSTVGYKTVKFGTYTLVGDGVTYKSGDKTIVELFADEVVAKAYFEAVVAGDVKAVLVGNKTVVLTAEQLLKSKNGYGGTSFNWAKAVEATTQYVIDNGFDATIGGFEINKDGMYQDNNGISTGATWVDIADYYTILKEAHAEAVKAVVKTASYFGYDSANDTVIKTTVSVDAKGKVVEAYLTEVQMPKNVVAEKIEGLDASDYVDAEVPAYPHGPMAIKHFYKTVKFGAYTLTFDATTKNYKCGDKTIGELFADEAVATDYHKAVVTNSITVVLKSGSNKKIMSAQTLSKNQNGYWTVEGQENTQWKVNVDATVNYVLENGFEALSFKAGADKIFSDNNGIATGATWTSMQTYYDALKVAYMRASGNYIGGYHYNSYGQEYGLALKVTVDTNNKITDIEVYSDEATGWISLSSAMPGWTETQRQVWIDQEAAYIKSFIGKTVEEVNAVKVAVNAVGQPTSVADFNIVTGATQCSGRLILALQNALSYIA